ncbi:hypothetical protein TREMEDRAFT_58676 [Tremella mesenterica DSM 1558]|uniref:uncharacterized protein n=1 Tax=Tremella mesenterica (strain ATCC 24925 / CBS 8224 / DSM 1558 / NBRC 9311 / NRRL Y-6157 / RJB 2259-6 / UBC 559-6) TaxID=578456 RepID=UPI0003F49E09|nr:uncharacterized protein TREMEDRAFT_58676 [Tremella mesenterica DSM 1558]EIW72504.1 hypothetical protein TREMEDRAFT_58676 [Tremella mesenterica DSM 1558]
MARPLTQHPSSALNFGFASRGPPLGFDFALSSPSSQTFTSCSATAAIPHYTFGSTHRSPSPHKSPLSRRRDHPGSLPPTSQFIGSNSKRNLKRSRRQSASSASGSNSATSSPTLTRRELTGESKKIELGSIAKLGIGEPRRKMIKRNQTNTNVIPTITENNEVNREDVDMGVMLASLPPPYHLRILLQLLQNDPSLSATVMPLLPLPELQDCEDQLENAVDGIKRLLLPFPGSATSASEREWRRVIDKVDYFCRMCTTYLEIFTKHSPTGLEKTYDILALLSSSFLQVLSLSPPPPSHAQSPSTPIERFGLSLIRAWSTWVSNLSENVNRRGGMFPHSTVSGWLGTLDTLAGQHAVNSWSSGAGTIPVVPGIGHPTVRAFREAMEPIRQKFITDLGWLAGR